MLAQNTTTIITSIITVIGTLGGAISGVLLSNRHTAKLEKLRIEQEKIKRNTAIIEEIYQMLIRIDDLCDAFAYDVKNSKESNLDIVGRIKEIRTTSERIKTLIRLYLPIFKKDLEEYVKNIAEYWNAVGFYYTKKGNQSS